MKQNLKELQATIRNILEISYSKRYDGQKAALIANANAALSQVNEILEPQEWAVGNFFKTLFVK